MPLPAHHELSEIPYAGFIAYRLKVTPEDFVVTEHCRLPLSKGKGSYRVYRLEKTGWNTVDLLLQIAKRKKVPFEKISYGGKKDRHAKTIQWITVPAKTPDLTDVSDQWTLEPIGFSDRRMDSTQIEANHFSIVLRSIPAREVPDLEKGVSLINKGGFVNYYDEQRFGGYDRDLGIPGINLFRGDTEAALYNAVTGIFPSEKKEARQRKLEFRRQWGDWKSLQGLAKTGRERKIFAALADFRVSDSVRKDVDFAAVFKKLPGEEIRMIVSAFQSWAWNGLVSNLLYEAYKSEQRGLVRLKFRATEPVLPLDGSRLQEKLRDITGQETLEIPVPGIATHYESAAIQNAYVRTLQSGEMEELKDPGEKRLCPMEFHRDAICFPEELKVCSIETDDLYPGRKKVRLEFSLPSGAYATMLIKHATFRRTGGSSL